MMTGSFRQTQSPLNGTRRVAFYAAQPSEHAKRVLEGLLRYADDHPGIAMRDFWDDLSAAGRTQALLAGPHPWERWAPHGVIAILPNGPESLAWARRAGVPLVSMGSEFRAALPSVYISPESIAALAVAHLRDSGYPNVGFVGVRGNVSVSLRRAALERRLTEAGARCQAYDLDVNPSTGLYDLEARAVAEPGLRRFLLEAPKPIGLLATTDPVGRVVCAACQQVGLRVPDEVGVLGIDDYLASRAASPTLSSIRTPGDQAGYEAMAMLDGLLGGRPVATSLAVPVSVVVYRQSTGAGPRGPESEVLRALATIRRRACEGVAVERILDELAVSRSTLQRQFAAMVGHTPGQEVVRVRLARAKELLRQTNLPISTIAAMTGYERSSSFSDFFQREAGTSPSSFRKAGANTIHNLGK